MNLFWKKGHKKKTGDTHKNHFYVFDSGRLASAANEIKDSGLFVGGGIKKFEIAGRCQLINLLQAGVCPDSKVLDFGCGCLRGGYWVMHFLNPGCYFGIEPHKGMLEAGINTLFDKDYLDYIQPSFSYNDDYDFGVFGKKFDFVISRSIWTHAPKSKIEVMLDSFVANTEPGAKYLTSILFPGFRGKDDYSGDEWVGKSHENEEAGTVAHSYEWIKEQCEKRELSVSIPSFIEHGNHTLLEIVKNKN